MAYLVGCVPFVNARPLVHRIEALGDASPLAVRYALPSELPALIESGTVHAALVSSVEALVKPRRRMVQGVCIGSEGPAASVRLFSRVPLEEIRSLALDPASLTSNLLARLVLKERFGCAPHIAAPTFGRLPASDECDAVVLIGDAGFAADEAGLNVLDLGEAWTEWTGLPFVWAAWIGASGLNERLAGLLVEAARWGTSHLDEIVATASKCTGWSPESTSKYLSQTMRYHMGERELEGLREFGERLLAAGLVSRMEFPAIVEAAQTAAVSGN